MPAMPPSPPPASPFQFHRHQRGRCLTNRAAVSGEFDILQPPTGVEFYGQMNFVAARGVIAMHAHGCVGQFAKISRSTRMIEDDFLIQLFEFLAHEKKRAAACRISIMRSISSLVL